MQKHVSCLGTCVIRDIYGIKEDSNYTVDLFIQSNSPISAVGDSLPQKDIVKEAIDQVDAVPGFYKRCLYADYSADVFRQLSEKKSDWLLLDMGCTRYQLYSIEMEDGSIRYLTDGLIDFMMGKIRKNGQNNEVIENIASHEKVDPLAFSDKDFASYLDTYLEKILEVYDENRIIIVDIKCVLEFVSSNQITYASGNSLTEWKLYEQRIRRAYNYVIEKMPKAHVVEFPYTVVGNAEHKWGLNTLHYIDEYYEYAYKAVDLIINMNNEDVIQEKRGLVELHDEYTKRCFDVYNSHVERYISLLKDNANKEMPLRLDSNLNSFKFDPNVWEEHMINGKVTLMVKTNQWKPRRYANLPMSRNLDEGKEYVLNARFKIRTEFNVLTFHLRDDTTNSIQILGNFVVPKGNDGSQWCEHTIRFKPNKGIYDLLMFGASQVSGSGNFLMIDYINIQEI